MARGRQRERAILLAAHEQLMAQGYERMTIDEVAARARSSKTTIYRRWKNKAELVKAVLDDLDARDNAIAETGALRSDLLAVMDTLRRKASAQYLAMLQDLTLAAKRDPVLAQALAEHVNDQSLSPFHTVLQRHLGARDVNFALVHDVAEALIMRQLHAGKRLDAAFAKRVVDEVIIPLLQSARSRR